MDEFDVEVNLAVIVPDESIVAFAASENNDLRVGPSGRIKGSWVVKPSEGLIVTITGCVH